MNDKIATERVPLEGVTGSSFSLHADGAELRAYHAQPERGPVSRLAVVVCHGYPSGIKAKNAAAEGQREPDLADRVARDSACHVVSFDYRGIADSTGDFSLRGWLSDLTAAVDHAIDIADVDGVALVGFRTGGALAMIQAATDERVRSLASLGAQADFRDWSSDPRRFLEQNRRLGMIKDPTFPRDVTAWARQLRELRPLDAVAKLAPRPLLLLHGADDETTPVVHARALAESYGSGADLRIVSGAGHFMRYDPRAVAILLGWIDRQTSASRPSDPTDLSIVDHDND